MFNEHGGFNVTLQGDVLLVVITGAWNAETAKAYQAVIEGAISPIKNQFWGLICNLSEWELCTPDCETMMINLVEICRENGLRREAIVCESESVKLDLFHKRDKIDSAQDPLEWPQRRFFKTNEQAKEWLMSEGYS